ncbi:MAG TPA: ribose-phosphate diphosphokinase [Kofleriaceae bacterium]|nr:ribose-phosphate diphosphokinase [Kofleriaceae bacterium]
MTETALVYATGAYEYLQHELADTAHFDLGTATWRNFPDGERYLRLLSPCTDRDVVVIGGTISDADTLALYDLASGVCAQGARRLTLVIPYFGYSTMERAVLSGEVVTAKVRARLLSSLPRAARGNRVMLLDLHAHGVAHYFEGDLQPVHLSAEPLIASAARRLGGNDFVLGSADAGRAKWVESIARRLGVLPVFVYKRRLDGERTEVAGISGGASGRAVVIYDDMIRSGSSLCGAAAAYRDAGATQVTAVATHGVFPGDALERIEASGLISQLWCTNSHPRAAALSSEFLHVQSIAGLLIERLRGGNA